ncbi:thymidine phosphorylase [bacterium]|nr:thymidine phosphorylase [bacterium]
MIPYEIILKKRNGGSLSTEEIEYFVGGYVNGDIQEYQMAAFLMAVYFKGMEGKELSEFVRIMVDSGDRVDLSGIEGFKIDKHSTGGVGDTTTLVLAPLVSSCGVKLAKMSGRGLGHTGGTLDKLESIPGFNISIGKEEFINIVNKCGLAVIGQTAKVAPADKKLYSLRDVTATVDSIPLIASSIMSKKLASGSDGIVLDVKTGSGAFMENLDDARELGKVMVDIGRNWGKKMAAVITDMNQPLGRAVGHTLEVREAIDTLRGKGPADLEELCLYLGGWMLTLAGKVVDYNEGIELLKGKIKDGSALGKFKEMIIAQGGNPEVVDNYDLIPIGKYMLDIKASQDGYLSGVKNAKLGMAVGSLGGGRQKVEDKIDYTCGVLIEKSIGDKLQKGDSIGKVISDYQDKLTDILPVVEQCFIISTEEVKPVKLIKEYIY